VVAAGQKKEGIGFVVWQGLGVFGLKS
jgi:hypothetical protein